MGFVDLLGKITKFVVSLENKRSKTSAADVHKALKNPKNLVIHSYTWPIPLFIKKINPEVLNLCLDICHDHLALIISNLT